MLRCFRPVFPRLTDAELATASMARLRQWDSAATLMLLVRVEREFQIRIEIEQAARFNSFRSVVRLVQSLLVRHADL